MLKKILRCIILLGMQTEVTLSEEEKREEYMKQGHSLRTAEAGKGRKRLLYYPLQSDVYVPQYRLERVPTPAAFCVFSSSSSWGFCSAYLGWMRALNFSFKLLS